MRGSMLAKVPTAPEMAQVAISAGHGSGALGARELGRRRRFETEGGGLGMDAVAAADGGGELVFEGALLEGGQELVKIGEQEVRGPHELDVEAGVQNIGEASPMWRKRASGPTCSAGG